MGGFLKKYRVLDLTDHRGLLAGKILADLGADVIQIEPPGGSPARNTPPLSPEGRSFYWDAFCAGKRSVTCDLFSPQDRELFERLVKSADILIESMNAADAKRAGLDHERLAGINPQLIHVSIRGFGENGPKAHYVDTDLILWAAGGALYGTSDEGRAPVRISAPQAYLHGAADAAGGALIALFARQKNGIGQHVRIDVQKSVAQATLSAVLADAVGDEAYQKSIESAGNETQPKKLDLSGSGSATQRKKSWQVKDGDVELHLAMGPATGKFTNNLFEWIRAEQFSNAPATHWDWTQIHKLIESGEVTADSIDDAHAVVREFLQRYTRRELIEASIARKLLIAPRLAIADLATSPHFAARGIFNTITGGDGAQRTIVGLPVKFTPPAGATPLRAAPSPGEHTQEIAAEKARAAPAAPPHITNVAPFDGLKVLDLSWVVAGPMVGRVLADFGATVVRVESSKRVDAARVLTPFQGCQCRLERSAVFHNCNAGKLGVTLDLAKAEALSILRDLVCWSDVIVESYSFGTMKKWGLDYESLRAINPGVILVSSTLMGQSGPYAPLAGFGNLGSAMSGIQALAGWPDRAPRGPFGPYTDYVGPRFGLAALIAALDARRESGQGLHIDISQAECGLQFLGPQMADYFATGHALSACGNDDAAMYPHGVYASAEDAPLRAKWLAIAIHSQAAWRSLAHMIGMPELSELAIEERRARHQQIDGALRKWCSAQTAAEGEQLLQNAGIAAHRVSSFRDFSEDAQLLHDGHILAFANASAGEAHAEASRYHLSKTPAKTRAGGPLMGEHNKHALLEILGYSPDEYDRFERAGLLA